MTLYLVQHGQSLPKDVDPDQGLSKTGVTETERIAGVAKDYQINIGHILHSVKTRARKTADIFASALNPSGGVKEVEGLKPMDDVAAFAADLSPDTHTMLIGHLPFMERMTSCGVGRMTATPRTSGGCSDRCRSCSISISRSLSRCESSLRRASSLARFPWMFNRFGSFSSRISRS